MESERRAVRERERESARERLKIGETREQKSEKSKRDKERVKKERETRSIERTECPTTRQQQVRVETTKNQRQLRIETMTPHVSGLDLFDTQSTNDPGCFCVGVVFCEISSPSCVCPSSVTTCWVSRFRCHNGNLQRFASNISSARLATTTFQRPSGLAGSV